MFDRKKSYVNDLKKPSVFLIFTFSFVENLVRRLLSMSASFLSTIWPPLVLETCIFFFFCGVGFSEKRHSPKLFSTLSLVFLIFTIYLGLCVMKHGLLSTADAACSIFIGIVGILMFEIIWLCFWFTFGKLVSICFSYLLRTTMTIKCWWK